MTKLFLTGATGYIGGDVLSVLTAKHPEISYSALVRRPERAAQVQEKYPSVRIVIGDLDDADLLKKESADADIVLHTADASDHVGAANAIAAGLAAGHTREKPGYWLHTGGTGILTYEDSDRQIYGERGGKIYDDLEGVDELVHLPDHAFHRNVDKIVLETGTRCADSVRTALVCPPTIYGQSWTPCERVGRIVDTYQGTGRGPVHQRSRQVYELSKITLQLRKGPIIGYGKSVWNNVHVHDLSDMFVLLVEAALAGKTDEGLWGGKAYYLAENGEHVWGDLSRLVVQTATKQGLLTAAKTEQMDFETGKKLAGFEAVSWGMNSRGKARRARKLLNWRPSRPSLEEEIPGIVKGEWERLQK